MATAKHFGPAIAGAVGNAAYETWQDKDHTDVHGFGKVFKDKLTNPGTLAKGAAVGTVGYMGAKHLKNSFFGNKNACYGDLEYLADKLAFVGTLARMVNTSAMAAAKKDRRSVARNGYWKTVGDKMKNPKRWLTNATALGVESAYSPIHDALIGGMANMGGPVGAVGKFLNSGIGRKLDPTSTRSWSSKAMGFAGIKTPYQIIGSVVKNPDSKLYSGLKGDFWEKGESKPYRSPVKEDSF